MEGLKLKIKYANLLNRGALKENGSSQLCILELFSCFTHNVSTDFIAVLICCDIESIFSAQLGSTEDVSIFSQFHSLFSSAVPIGSVCAIFCCVLSPFSFYRFSLCQFRSSSFNVTKKNRKKNLFLKSGTRRLNPNVIRIQMLHKYNVK